MLEAEAFLALEPFGPSGINKVRCLFHYPQNMLLTLDTKDPP
jgi:hypothetical protein